jgi:hypothetical protein
VTGPVRVVRYVGGPLDGKTLDVSGWTDGQILTGSEEIVPGWDGRADYEPDAGGDPLVWQYRGPTSG